MELDLHLNRQNVYKIKDIQVYLTGLAGQFSKQDYYIDGMIFNTESPVSGFTLRNASDDDCIDIDSDLDENFDSGDYRGIELININITYHNNEVRKLTHNNEVHKYVIQRFYFVRYLQLFVSSYENAKKMVDKHKQRLVNYDGYFNWIKIPITKASVKLLHNIKGFKTIKPDNVELSVMTRINHATPKTYRLHNLKTGRFAFLDLNTVHIEEVK